MKGAITWEQVLTLCAILSVLAGAWWFLFAYILSVKRELNEHKLEVAKGYASQAVLKDLEKRLVTELRELKQEFHTMPERFAAVFSAAKKDK
ncbi:hypothetical protein [Roseibium sediminis]|uniref:hypothetical protein n=1 Tax=Roseibium sediminis TaxID=1775174 RepID=UPI00123CBF55|nr:hypothetical protein [Roseibium sediminis]